jgi:hypothetical protein
MVAGMGNTMRTNKYLTLVSEALCYAEWTFAFVGYLITDAYPSRLWMWTGYRQFVKENPQRYLIMWDGLDARLIIMRQDIFQNSHLSRSATNGLIHCSLAKAYDKCH